MNRPDVHTWAMNMVDVVSTRSEDPSTQVGAVILDTMGRVVSTGYNGLPRGLSTDEFTTSERPAKYQHIVHADLNAILFADRHALPGSTMYLPFLPCCECAKAIIQVGISRVVYKSEYRIKDERGSQDVGLKMLRKAGVRVVLFDHIKPWKFEVDHSIEYGVVE